MAMGCTIPPLHARPAMKNNVQISQFSQLFLIPYDDAKSKWYTHEELRIFNKQRISDVLNVRNMLKDGTHLAGSEDTHYGWVGIERILYPQTARRLARRRRAHINNVLSAQIMMQNDDDKAERLAEISQKTSQWSRNSAIEIATCNARL